MNSVTKKNFAVLSGLIAASLCVPAASFASDSDEIVSTVTVHIGDVNPQTAAGARIVLSRLDKAAETVCGNDYFVTRRLASPKVMSCEQHALAPAVEQIDSAVLTAMFIKQFPSREVSVLVGPVKTG